MNSSSYPTFRESCQSRPRDQQRRNSQVHEQLPEDGKHDSLTSVRDDPRLQSAAEQTQQSIHSHDGFGSGKVSDLAFVNLAVRLDDTQGV